MKRDVVFRLVSEEREYQDHLKNDRTDKHQHSVGEELILMEAYLRRAFDAWANHPGDRHALDEIRKLAAIAVRCMENNGVPSRARSSASGSGSGEESDVEST